MINRNQNKLTDSFIEYLKAVAIRYFRSVTVRVYFPILIAAFIYTIYDEGFDYALEYFFFAILLLFLIYLYSKIYVLIFNKEVSRNNWILNIIIISILALISLFIFELKQIGYLVIMSLAIFIIATGTIFLGNLLRRIF